MCLGWQRPGHQVNESNANLSEIDPFCGAGKIFPSSSSCIIIIEIPAGNNRWDDPIPERFYPQHRLQQLRAVRQKKHKHWNLRGISVMERGSRTNRVKSLDNARKRKNKV